MQIHHNDFAQRDPLLGRRHRIRLDDKPQCLANIVDPLLFGRRAESERIESQCLTGAISESEHLPLESSWRGFYAWLSNNYAEILDGCQIRPEYFNINQFIHNGSEWCCGGVYENVLAQSDNPTAWLKGKRLLIFELENIKAKPQLLSIVVHLIGIAIRTLVWEQPGKRGFIIYEYLGSSV